jgi:hypothetical protein
MIDVAIRYKKRCNLETLGYSQISMHVAWDSKSSEALAYRENG